MVVYRGVVEGLDSHGALHEELTAGPHHLLVLDLEHGVWRVFLPGFAAGGRRGAGAIEVIGGGGDAEGLGRAAGV